MEFSLTRNSSRTPSAASQRASSRTSVGRRLTNEPRNVGIAQNVQRRSQPLASLSGAIGPLVEPGRAEQPTGGGGAVAAAARRARSAAAGAGPAGVCGVRPLPRHDRRAAGPRCRGSRRSRAPRRPRAATRRARRRTARPCSRPRPPIGLGPPSRSALEVGGLEQRVDRVLLGLLDEAAGVDHDRVGVGRVVDEPEPVGGQPAGELLGVDLVAGAPEGHQGDRQQSLDRGRWSGGRSGVCRSQYCQSTAASTIEIAANSTAPVPAKTSWAGWPVVPSAPWSWPSTVTSSEPSVVWIRTGGTTCEGPGLAERERAGEHDLAAAVADHDVRATAGGGERDRHRRGRRLAAAGEAGRAVGQARRGGRHGGRGCPSPAGRSTRPGPRPSPRRPAPTSSGRPGCRGSGRAGRWRARPRRPGAGRSGASAYVSSYVASSGADVDARAPGPGCAGGRARRSRRRRARSRRSRSPR